MRNDFWAELELEPTADIRAIRHAYARRSRDCHPEESPEEFQQLHDAYEAALRWAKQHAAAEPAPIPTPPAAAPSQQPESSDFENPEEPEIQEIFRKKVQQNKSSDEFRKPKAAAEPEESSDICPPADPIASEMEELVAKGLESEKKQQEQAVGHALSALYHLYRDASARNSSERWTALLNSSTFSPLRENPRFYPILQQFLTDHYKAIPDAAWLSLRDVFPFSPETEELYKLISPRCRQIEQKSEAQQQKKVNWRSVVYFSLFIAIVSARATNAPSIVFYLLLAATIICLLLDVFRERIKKSTRKR